MTSRISLMPESTALNETNRALVVSAMMRASVVLPVPGGPHRMMDCSRSRSIASRSGLPGREQLLLADELVEGARPHPLGQRCRRVRFREQLFGEQGIHKYPDFRLQISDCRLNFRFQIVRFQTSGLRLQVSDFRFQTSCMSHCTHAVKRSSGTDRPIMKTRLLAVLIVAAFTGLTTSRMEAQGPGAGSPPLPPTPKDVQPGSITCEDVPYP